MSSSNGSFRSPPQFKLRRELLLLLFVQILALHCNFASGSERRWGDGGGGAMITQADLQALQAIKSAFNDPTGALRSWNSTATDGACSGGWAGVRCLQGRVVAIQLPWRGLGGRISDSVGQLAALRRLSLHDNSIGGQLPDSLGFLPNLRGVYLFNNRLAGSIPPAVGNCLRLQTLDVSRNFITGSIPESIANSTYLLRLNLSYNTLQGSIPVTLTTSSSLVFLSLQHNNLSGPVPDTWGGGDNSSSTAAHRLRILELDHNSLSGRIPASLSKLAMLQVVSLAGNNIGGSIPEELGELPSLQTLDLSGNSINGSFPVSLCNLSSLAYLNLANNRLTNEIPTMIDGLKNLTFLSLEQNQFEGKIPPALGNVTTLSSLDLSDNKLAGEIPVSLVQLSHLTHFDVSDNNLSGPVPLTLAAAFGSSPFRGNLALCGYNTAVPCSPPSSSSPSSAPGFSSSPITLVPTLETPAPRGKKLSTKEVILIISGCVLVFLLLLCSALLCFLMKNRGSTGKKSATASVAAARGEKPGPGAVKEAESSGGKLVLLDGPFAFTADDLLCATAEIMGKSSFGTVYKATLEDGNQVAVKRLREKIVKPPKDFEAEADVIGRIRHPNLITMRAYYMGPKGEKLLVFDYMPKGSLAAFLHARGPDTPVDWRTRARVALGAAKGLSHLHSLSPPVVHGCLTSTTILLDGDTAPKLTDFALSRLTTTVNPTPTTSAYRAPELAKAKKPAATSDVYSLGVVMLELLTGKSPAEDGVELPTWVASVVEEEWANEVFDVELVRKLDGKKEREEIMDTMKLALHCVDPDPKARPEAAEVVKQLEEIMPELAAEEGRTTASPVKLVKEGGSDESEQGGAGTKG